MTELRFVMTAEAPRRALGSPPHVAIPGNRWDLLDGVEASEHPLVSVIVPYYEQQAELDRTVAALARQTYPAERIEIIVVDDGSRVAPSVPPGARVVRQLDRGFRVAAARNLGVRHSGGELLCFLDADSSPEPQYLRELTRLPALAPDVVTVATRRHADVSGQPVDVPIERAGPANALPQPRWLDDEYARTDDMLRADDRSYRFVIGAVICCRRSLFEEVGGFDETFTEYGGEDWEWAHRAWMHGAAFAHVPGAVAWHDGPDWAARARSPEQRVAQKNAETIRLAASISVSAGSPRAVRMARSRIVVHVHSTGTLAGLIVSVDEILAALPHATVIVPNAATGLAGDTFRFDDRVVVGEPDSALSASAAILVDLPVASRGLADALAEAVQKMTTDDLATVELTDSTARTLARLSSQRAARRETRWNGLTLFDRASAVVPAADRIADEPDLEAYFGGWS